MNKIDFLKGLCDEVEQNLIVSDEMYKNSFRKPDREMALSYIIGYLRGALYSVQSQLEGL